MTPQVSQSRPIPHYRDPRAVRERPPVSRSRLLTVAVMVVSLLVTGALQNIVSKRNHELIRNTASTATLSNLNSFSLALLLGGLRGPLVMLLWTSSENQKHDKDLEDFDTKIELIRLLQPEFDSVHIFQVWNLAYNISVQMVNQTNKYAAILKAVDYCRKVDQQRPDDINTLSSFGGLFFDKLGNSAEKFYYEARVREETKWREPDRIRPGDAGWRRTKLDAMLDPKGNLLPGELVETTPRPAGLPSDAPWNTGAELQYLKKYEPWPYGLPPMGIGYNYAKRAQVLQEVGHQRHLQLGEVIMDNRPAIDLNLWAQMETSDAQWAEARAFGRAPAVRPVERMDLELPTADVSPTTQPVDPAALAEAIYHYDLVSRISEDTVAEFKRHMAKYLVNFTNFQSQLESAQGLQYQSQGDRDYLRAMTAPASQQAAIKGQAVAAYKAAVKQYEMIILRFYLSESADQRVMQGVNRNALADLSPEKIDAMTTQARSLLAADTEHDGRAAERHEYDIYLKRCEERLKLLEK